MQILQTYRILLLPSKNSLPSVFSLSAFSTFLAQQFYSFNEIQFLVHGDSNESVLKSIIIYIKCPLESLGFHDS